MKLFLTEEQINQLLRAAYPNRRDFALFHLTFSTGLRAVDIRHLKRNNLIKEYGVVKSVKCIQSKTGRRIERPLREDARHALAWYLANRTDSNPYVFRSESRAQGTLRNPLAHRGLHNIYKKYLRAIGIPEDRLQGNATHVPRRSVAKLIVNASGGAIAPAAAFLDHTDIATTTAYLDMDEAKNQSIDIVLNHLEW